MLQCYLDLEEMQSRSSGEVKRLAAQHSTLRPTVRTTKRQTQPVVDAAVQQWAGFAHNAGVSGESLRSAKASVLLSRERLEPFRSC